MAGRDRSTISKRMKGVASEARQIAEIQTEGGLQAVALIPESLIVEWLPKDNPFFNAARYERINQHMSGRLENRGAVGQTQLVLVF